MRITGIIAEYNPLHNGHIYQLQQARQQSQADLVIVCMSGNYVQRGQAALLDKWTRAELALQNGADMVVELPFVSAVQPADRFATGAVQLLAALGCQTIAFGSEQPTFDYQQAGQQIIDLPEQSAAFVDYQKTYATQLNEFYQEQLSLQIDQPNHLLGISYAVANARLAQPLNLLAIKREQAQHGDQTVSTAPYASASAIRQVVTQGTALAALQHVVPAGTLAALADSTLLTEDQLWPLLKYRIESLSPAQLRQVYQMSEGLEYRFKKVIHKANSYTELLQALKTKRYTYARLQRVCLYVLLNIQPTDIQQGLQRTYIRLLGFNEIEQATLTPVEEDD
ncbi:nucleotidyltransferase [Latilactobacillus sakei]